MAQTSILADEAERFGKLANDWWDPSGSSAMLHKLNPVRLKYIRDRVDQHWQVDECSRTPLSGKTALDVGCGAGLLAEPLVRLGAKVTGLDASPELIAVANEHARACGLEVDYIGGELEQIDGQFDLVTWIQMKRVSRMVTAGPVQPTLSPGPFKSYNSLPLRLDPPDGDQAMPPRGMRR